MDYKEAIKASSLTDDRKRQFLHPILRMEKEGHLVRNGLFDLYIRQNLLDLQRRLYVPTFARDERLVRYQPAVSVFVHDRVDGDEFIQCVVSLFGNPLALPSEYGTADYHPHRMSPPSDRATDAGFFVVTIEIDAGSPEDLEAQAEILVSKGKGRPEESPIGQMVHRRLLAYLEYRGMTAIFSGNKSIHFHFVFATEEVAAELVGLGFGDQTARWMRELHEAAWDRVAEIFCEAFRDLGEPDRAMRGYVQLRRLPWGTRVQDGNKWLGLPEGTQMLQVPLIDMVRNKRPNGASERFLAAPDLAKPTRRQVRPSTRDSEAPLDAELRDDVVVVIGELVRDDWESEWPQPAVLDYRGGEPRLRFFNHPGDHNPSSVVRGDHRQVLLQGAGAPDGLFFLPNGMTLTELIPAAMRIVERRQALAPLAEDRPFRGMPSYAEKAMRAKAEQLRARDDHSAIVKEFRDALRAALDMALDAGSPAVIKSPEGLGKSTTLFGMLSERQFEHIVASEELVDDPGGPRRGSFLVFSYRSYKQAYAKRTEYESITGRPAIVLESVSQHYQQACMTVNEDPLDVTENADLLEDFIAAIRARQPSVFEEMEKQRKAIWETHKFDPAMTAIFTVHSVPHHWHHSRSTRAWSHPDYHPDLSEADIERLTESFTFHTVVHDEIEMDSILDIIPEDLWASITACRDAFPDWRNQDADDRLAIFRSAKETHAALEDVGYWRFDELMRLNPANLSRARVNSYRFRFGHDNHEEGIYRRQNGRNFYIAPKQWLSESPANLIFLTTEELPTRALERMSRRFKVCRLEESPVHPLIIPLTLDNRARKEHLHELVTELHGQDPNANVICDMIGDPGLAITHQMAKGSNDLREGNLYVIATHLSPDLYAQLAALGSYLDYEDVITQYYVDQISQSVGRNTGFRHDPDSNWTARVIMSRRLWPLLRTGGFNELSRVRLQVDTVRERRSG